MTAQTLSGWAEARLAALDGWKPGAIRRRSLAAADWRFLLPELRYERVLFVGTPKPGVLRALAEQAGHLTVLAPAFPGGDPPVGESSPSDVTYVVADPRRPLPLRDGAFDLLVDAGGRRDASLPEREVRRLLTPAGVSYRETRGSGRGLTHGSRNADAAGVTHSVLWTVRRGGGLRVAVPVEDANTAGRYLVGSVLYGVSRRGRILHRASTVLARLGVLHHALPGRGVIRHGPEGQDRRAFAYAWRAAESAGIDLRGYRGAFFARGDYDSNKAALFLFPPGGVEPEIILKMTRSAEYNGRLRAEHDALVTLERAGYVEPSTYPRALFFDDSSGLAIQAQQVVPGTPFRIATTGAPDCPLVRSGIDWITTVGTRSAEHAGVDAGLFGEWLLRLLDRYETTCAPEPEVRSFLRSSVGRLVSSGGSVPLVFRHGDAGTWNLLRRDDGGIAFLDWEASEPAGPPLWDLFDFLRSAGIWMARKAGERDREDSYRRRFLQRTATSELQREAVERYARATGLEGALIEPIFLTCWVHRALREAAWSGGAPDEGQYTMLLRLFIENRRSPGIAWMFS